MENRTPIPRQVLQKFILGFPDREVSPELQSYLASGLGGVIVFARNFQTPQELLGLTNEIRRASGEPLFIGIDQEGGNRFALPLPFIQWPSAEDLGLLDDLAAVEGVARGIARELLAAGCNLDFAPMLDLHLQLNSPVTSGRSFGADPNRVGELGAAFAHGLAAEGVLACAKHFPGHGDTKVDPHESLPVFEGAMERLRQTELVPFARVFEEHVPMLMTAHILLPKIDAENPATLSRRILTELLRKEMAFNGVVVADDLGMGAIRERLSAGEAAIATFSAGADMAMLCHDWDAVGPALQEVTEAFEKHVFLPEEWEASRRRIEELRRRIEKQPRKTPLAAVGCDEHRKLAEKIRQRIEAKRLEK
jgi:beta-N-acetylhexosaminidase